MSDPFIHRLFTDVLQKMGMDTTGLTTTQEYPLLVDEQYPVLLRYDGPSERVLLIAGLDPALADTPETLPQRILRAALNPLRGKEPGAGLDEGSGLYFAFLALPRQTVTAENVCREIGRLVEWTKALLASRH
ncbi:type III secretion system chaperone [Pseudomonas indica]|uniref:type III secretion system chaperone n=1 Tax=Pseudomonas indica TaxID=137658 RepID=UPI003FD552B5